VRRAVFDTRRHPQADLGSVDSEGSTPKRSMAAASGAAGALAALSLGGRKRFSPLAAVAKPALEKEEAEVRKYKYLQIQYKIYLWRMSLMFLCCGMSLAHENRQRLRRVRPQRA
jgi:hypothetical protein